MSDIPLISYEHENKKEREVNISKAWLARSPSLGPRSQATFKYDTLHKASSRHKTFGLFLVKNCPSTK
jgi:hypothetical protein